MDNYKNFPMNNPIYDLNNGYINQLQPILSNNPAEATLASFKELSRYPNYGKTLVAMLIYFIGAIKAFGLLKYPQPSSYQDYSMVKY